MKRFLIVICFLLFTLLVAAGWYLAHFGSVEKKTHYVDPKSESGKKLLLKLNSRAHEVKTFVNTKGYSENVCFLIDMSIESGSNRFFVYDLQKDSVLDAGLVTHGRCNKTWLSGRKYGNTVGCGCTSLGKYKIGNDYKGKFGLAYKLHGLDSTNSNAFKRFVVLHSHECVPDREVDPAPICQSDGCPTVSQAFLRKLAAVIDRSDRPVLMWVFE